jgi:hypothetical protein
MDKKFIAVLDPAVEFNKLLIALGHISCGLAGMNNVDNIMEFISYSDVEGNEFPNISQYPFIVLKGKQNRIKSFREELIAKNLPYSSFLNTMLSGGSELQQKITLEKKLDEIKILAIVTFGDKEILDLLTKKFSLWR